jgi:hypothetical protein
MACYLLRSRADKYKIINEKRDEATPVFLLAGCLFSLLQTGSGRSLFRREVGDGTDE